MNTGAPRSFNSPSAALTALVLAFLIVLPFVVSTFWSVNVVGRAASLGVIALSLTFLARYGGFVSLAQMFVAGVAGYVVAMTVPEAIPANAAKLPYSVAVPLALAAATVTGLLVGAIAVRTREIYLLMITLALSVGFYYFAQSNLEYLNGYEGIRNVLGPEIFGVSFRNPYVSYYATITSAVGLYAFVLYLARTPFGLSLQGVRDNARRVSALGFNVALHRVAAFGFAGFIAGWGGVLSTIYNIGIAPGQVSIHATFSILIIAVIGGLGHPIGAFVGALVYTLIDTFAADLYDRERFNTLVGGVFLIMVLVSPDGALGIIKQITRRVAPAIARFRASGGLSGKAGLADKPAE